MKFRSAAATYKNTINNEMSLYIDLLFRNKYLNVIIIETVKLVNKIPIYKIFSWYLWRDRRIYADIDTIRFIAIEILP